MVDDLDGAEAQETVRFGVDGTDYEIDLTAENAEKLRSILSLYVDKGRKSSAGRRGQSGQARQATSTPSTTKSKREETQQIRQWAKDNGHNPSSRGRITQSIIDAYNEAR